MSGESSGGLIRGAGYEAVADNGCDDKCIGSNMVDSDLLESCNSVVSAVDI